MRRPPLAIPRPTRKAASLVIGALILFGAGANAQAGWLYVLGACLVGVLVAGFFIPPLTLRRIKVTRVVDEWGRVDEPVRASLEIWNGSRLQRGPFRGIDRFVGEHRFVIGSLAPRSKSTFAYDIIPPRRGVFEQGDIELRSGVPFGVAWTKRAFRAQSRLVVHPRWAVLSSFPLLEAASAPLESLHERPLRGAGMDFHGLREHRSGDSLRHVHWRSSARGSALLVKEYEANLASRLTVLIDGGIAGVEPRTSFEDAIAVAASLLVYALDSGHPVQMFAPGSGRARMIFEPGKQQGLDWLSELEADRSFSLSKLAAEASPEVFRRSTSVMIFPSLKTNISESLQAVEILQTRSARVVAVMLPARAYEGGSARGLMTTAEESGLLDQLTASRALAYRLSGTGDRLEDIAHSLRVPWSGSVS